MKKLTKEKLTELIHDELEKQRLDEAFTPEEYKELSKIIRLELASVMYDLFRRKNFWVDHQ